MPLLFEWVRATDDQILALKKVIRNLTINVDHLELISQTTWKARDDEFEQMTQSEFTDLYKKLVNAFDELLANEDEWMTARGLKKPQE